MKEVTGEGVRSRFGNIIAELKGVTGTKAVKKLLLREEGNAITSNECSVNEQQKQESQSSTILRLTKV